VRHVLKRFHAYDIIFGQMTAPFYDVTVTAQPPCQRHNITTYAQVYVVTNTFRGRLKRPDRGGV
jgi:hypothetical protein